VCSLIRMTEAGWYEDPSNSAVIRWYDGSVWTDQTRVRPESLPPPAGAPIVVPPEAPATDRLAASPSAARPCPYCLELIPSEATRCSQCSGKLRFCPRCGENVGTVETKKPVTLLFRKTIFHCKKCGKKLGESRVDA
jgi:hypothetical protein